MPARSHAADMQEMIILFMATPTMSDYYMYFARFFIYYKLKESSM